MPQNEITLDEHQFRLSVVKSLGRLEALAQSTENHLARLNGTVARHEEKIAALQATVLAQRVASKEASAWWRRVAPLLWLAVGGMLVLFLLHSDHLLRVFSKP